MNPAKLAPYLMRGAEFLVAPRRFLRSLETDDAKEVIGRLIALAISFAALQVLLFSQSLDVTIVLLVGILDTALGIALVPVFYVVLRSLNAAHPWRVAIVYVLTMRFTYLVPALVMYALFIMTEHYLFALLRGVAIAIYLLLLFSILPFAYFDRTPKRLVALALGVVAFVAYTLALDALSSATITGRSKLSTISLLYDPIGTELDKLVPENWQHELGFEEPPEFRLAATLAKGGRSDSTGEYVTFPRDSMVSLALKWRGQASSFERASDVHLASLTARLDSAKFETTKIFLIAHLHRTLEMRKVAELLTEYSAAPEAELFTDILKRMSALRASEIKLLDQLADNLDVRIWLRDFLFLNIEPPQSRVSAVGVRWREFASIVASHVRNLTFPASLKRSVV